MSRKLAKLLERVGRRQVIDACRPRDCARSLRVPVAELSDSYIGLAVYADIRYLSRSDGRGVRGQRRAAGRRARPAACRHSLYRELKQLPAMQAVNARADVIENLEFIVETQRIFIGFLVDFRRRDLFQQPAQHVADRPGRAAARGGHAARAGLHRMASRRTCSCARAWWSTRWARWPGLPLGYSLAYVLSRMYDTEMFRFPLVSPPRVWYGTIAMARSCSRWWPMRVVQRTINQLDWLDASKTKE